MAGVASAISSAFLQAAAGQNLTGTSMPQMAEAIGQSVARWLPTVTIRCGTVGCAGAGVVNGSLVVPPLPLAVVLFASQGMKGPSSAQLANAIVVGISASVSGLPYTGPSSTVGVGTALGKVVMVNQAALTSLLAASLPASFLTTVPTTTQPQLAAAIATVISAQLMLGFGAGVVVGSVSPTSAGGLASCQLVVS
jgi:hypothetical protein